ncbi:hypothetical protein Tco_0672204 [Tanacetum coccineum]
MDQKLRTTPESIATKGRLMIHPETTMVTNSNPSKGRMSPSPKLLVYTNVANTQKAIWAQLTKEMVGLFVCGASGHFKESLSKNEEYRWRKRVLLKDGFMQLGCKEERRGSTRKPDANVVNGNELVATGEIPVDSLNLSSKLKSEWPRMPAVRDNENKSPKTAFELGLMAIQFQLCHSGLTIAPAKGSKFDVGEKWNENAFQLNNAENSVQLPNSALLKGAKDFVSMCMRHTRVRRCVYAERKDSGKTRGYLPQLSVDRDGEIHFKFMEIISKAVGLIQETTEKIVLIKQRMQAAHDRQKSYADRKRKPMEFEVGDRVMLKVLPWKGVVRSSCRLEGIHVDDKLQFVEEPVEIMEWEIKRLKRSRIPLVKVRWNSRRGPEFTWEREDSFKQKYPQLFTNRASSSNTRS